MLDDSTKQEIDIAVMKVLREAGMKEPPFQITELLEHLEVHREYYDLEDSGLLQRFRHKVRVGCGNKHRSVGFSTRRSRTQKPPFYWIK